MNDDSPSFVPARRFRTGVSVALATLSLCALVVMANYLAATRKVWRYDLAGRDRPPLTPLTVQTLAALTNDVKVTVLFSPQSGLYPHVVALLREYRACSRHIVVETIDPTVNPSLAMDRKRQYKLGAGTRELVVFESAGRWRVVADSELSIYHQDDIRSLMQHRETAIRRAGFLGENRFTSALAALFDNSGNRAAYLVGHGEHPPDSEDEQVGYGAFMRLLADEKNLTVEPVKLATHELSLETQLLIIAGPTSPLLPVELARIQSFLERGGRLLVGLNPYAVETKTGLEDLLLRWSIFCPPSYAAEGDRDQSRTGLDVISLSFGTHPLMAPLRREGFLYFPYPRLVSSLAADSLPVDAAKADVLVMTSDQGLTKSDLSGGGAGFDPRRDRRNVAVPLAVAAEKGGVSGVATGRGATRIVVVGDSNVFKNETIEQGRNRDFAALCVSWLLDRPQMLAIGAKPIREWRVELGSSQLVKLRWLLLGALPGGVLLLGLAVCFRRRS